MSLPLTVFSDDRVYRYVLRREWDKSKPACMFIGLNPSTADEVKDDPTVRRCINYAKAWGYGGLMMANIFAFRATDPRDMKAAADPVGSDNNYWLIEMAKEAGVIVAAWGTHGGYMDRGKYVAARMPNLKCLKITKGGYPSHPLYLKKDLVPIPYKG